jgi:hypothetical protein
MFYTIYNYTKHVILYTLSYTYLINLNNKNIFSSIVCVRKYNRQTVNCQNSSVHAHF